MDLYEVLTDSVDSSATVERIIRGEAWTAAQLDDGSFGIAISLSLDTRPRIFKSLIGLKAKDAAQAVRSWNLSEASEAMAVINACLNTPSRIERLSAAGEYELKSTHDMDITGKKCAVIGHMSRQAEALRGADEVYIIERAPKDGDYPDSACEYLLPQCDIVVITASALVNKTMPRLLELAKNAKTVILGPTAPLCPELKSLGVYRISGMAVTDIIGFEDWMMRVKGNPYPFGRVFEI